MIFGRKICALNWTNITAIKWRQYSALGCSHLQERILTEDMKKDIENHWRDKLNFRKFDRENVSDKFYVLSMFPYPSGSLHMGHVRVYSIADAIARFYRFQGKNVFQPMGWDSFGLPAENAALQRKIPADEWTNNNIEHMRKQLDILGCSFDWESEVSTCDPAYYKWTQKLFLMLFDEGLVYQKEAMVNWDPVDKTVLADEQVDENGCSWRSGAKVEKKLLKQWFIKTTKFAEQLYNGLKDPILEDWRDIINLQEHWIGECDGWNFTFNLSNNKKIVVWSKTPEDFQNATFIAIKPQHLLNGEKIEEGVLDLKVQNPFGSDLPVIVSQEVEYPAFNEVYVGGHSENDIIIAEKYKIPVSESRCEKSRDEILRLARELNMGADYKISSKLKDWLISRQRYWGTPIPIIHCQTCGPVPVADNDLPVELPKLNGELSQPLNLNDEWLKCSCPKCGNEARRESDTMDTFVDSSWYFLRYLDAKNKSDITCKDLGKKLMPVDIYVGGKEHAVLHLYYARFMSHFLHQKGYLSHPEPFKRLLVQGMVKGKSYHVHDTGRYLKQDEVEIINEKKGNAIERVSGKKVVIMWEKMSKSKFNGVDPIDVISTHGCDTTRLIMLGDVAPTSHRNWSEATFPGIINWQKRLWLTIHDFVLLRARTNDIVKSDSFNEQEEKLFDSANYFASTATFNFKVTHQLSVAMSKMQGLTNAIRRSSQDVVVLSEQYERALSAQIIMLAPFAPHFASELWTRFVAAPNRVCENSEYINWSADVFTQKWPRVDENYQIKFHIKVNHEKVELHRVPCRELNVMNKEQALHIALNCERVVKFIKDRKVLGCHLTIYPDYEGTVDIFTKKADAENRSEEQRVEQ